MTELLPWWLAHLEILVAITGLVAITCTYAATGSLKKTMAVVVFFAALFAWAASRGRARKPDLQLEFDKIDAETDAKKLEIERGREVAITEVKKRHKAAVEKLEAEELEDVEKAARGDPGELARRLVEARRRTV